MQQHLAEVERRGAQVVAIGQGTGRDAREFCGRAGVTFPCLGDPGRESYRGFALPRGGWRAILLDPLLVGREGVRRLGGVDVRGALLPTSDWFQLGGVAIVDREGVLRYVHRARHPADLPAPAALLQALDAVAAGPGVTIGR
jgi:hypothetical protein